MVLECSTLAMDDVSFLPQVAIAVLILLYVAIAVCCCSCHVLLSLCVAIAVCYYGCVLLSPAVSTSRQSVAVSDNGH